MKPFLCQAVIIPARNTMRETLLKKSMKPAGINFPVFRYRRKNIAVRRIASVARRKRAISGWPLMPIKPRAIAKQPDRDPAKRDGFEPEIVYPAIPPTARRAPKRMPSYRAP